MEEASEVNKDSSVTGFIPIDAFPATEISLSPIETYVIKGYLPPS